MTLLQLCAAHAVLLVLSVGLGWSVASWQGARIEVTRGSANAGSTSGFLEDAMLIVSANVRVVSLLVLGACTGGVLTLLTFVWNGYLLGFGLSALHRAQPEAFVQVLAYVPIEFGAFTLAAAASMHLALRVGRALVAREPLALGPTAATLMASMILLAAAAVVESCVKARLLNPL